MSCTGGNSTYVVALEPALTEAADSNLVYLDNITTANEDGSYSETSAPPGGWGGKGSSGHVVGPR